MYRLISFLLLSYSTILNAQMKIVVGSENQLKVKAVEDVVSQYFHDVHISGREVPPGVSTQPISLDETIRGAINRAKGAFKDCDLSVGIETGLFEVSYTETGYMNISACAIYNGEKIHIGLSSAFECPMQVTYYMIHERLDMNQAIQKAGECNPALLSADNHHGIFVNRFECVKQAVSSAFLKITKSRLYRNT